jgi:hypothetical protein
LPFQGNIPKPLFMLQKFSFFILSLTVVLFFASCEKELSAENGSSAGSQSGTAVFTWEDGTGECISATVEGDYKKGVALNATNLVIIQVNVVQTGTYTITSSSANGVVFSISGSFTTTGPQTVELIGSGIPQEAGVYAFGPGTASCSFRITFTAGGSSGGTASFTLNGTPGNCVSPPINGDYIKGAALTSTNTVALAVNVTAIGTYSISTNALNGISFSGSGTFTATGAQTITLTGSGTPAAAGIFNYIPGANGCSFGVTVNDAITNDDCKSCSYTPVCVGAKYTYEVIINTTPSVLNQEVLGPETDTLVNGSVYRKLQGKSVFSTGETNSGFSYYNCTNNETTVFQYQVSNINGTRQVDFIKTTLLKANEPVGGKWADVITIISGQPVTNTYTIEAKDISLTILGKTYDNIIHVSYEQFTTVLGFDIPTGSGNYYYAKNIGLVKFDSDSFGAQAEWEIKDYFIP